MATNAARATVALHIAEGRKVFKRQVWRGEALQNFSRMATEGIKNAAKCHPSKKQKIHILFMYLPPKKIVYACIPRTTVVIFNRSDAVETATPTLWRPAGALLEHQDQGHCSATTRRIAPHQQWSRTLRAVHVQICLCQPVRQLRVSLLGSPSEKRNLFQ